MGFIINMNNFLLVSDCSCHLPQVVCVQKKKEILLYFLSVTNTDIDMTLYASVSDTVL